MQPLWCSGGNNKLKSWHWHRIYISLIEKMASIDINEQKFPTFYPAFVNCDISDRAHGSGYT